jgi:HSP20 family molecular chaperone IbpA
MYPRFFLSCADAAACKGRFQKLYEEGKTLHLTVSKPGFKTRELTVETGKTARKEFKITLEKQKEDSNKTAALKDAKKEDEKQETARKTEKPAETGIPGN